MNDTLDGSSKAINIERAAYNEAGHAIVGRFQAEMDMLQAEALARGRYPDNPQKQEEMLHNSTSLARKILSEPRCWRAVKNLAQAAAEVLVKEPVLNGDQVHEIISQALAQEEDDTPENHID